MARIFAAVAFMGLLAAPEGSMQSQPQLPIIDMHVHSTTTRPGDMTRLNGLDVTRSLFLAGLAADLRDWAAFGGSRVVPALVFPCDRGRAHHRPLLLRERHGPSRHRVASERAPGRAHQGVR